MLLELQVTIQQLNIATPL